MAKKIALHDEKLESGKSYIINLSYDGKFLLSKDCRNMTQDVMIRDIIENDIMEVLQYVAYTGQAPTPGIAKFAMDCKDNPNMEHLKYVVVHLAEIE